MRREVEQSLRKALSIILVFGSVFGFIQRKWLIGIGILVVAYLVIGDEEPPADRHANRDMRA